MPSWKPHNGSAAGQPGSWLTATSDDFWLGPLLASVVCAFVFGTYINVMTFVLNEPGGSSFADPFRYGSTGAKKYASEPDRDPLYAPAPAMTRSL